jgi:hypothetical protein
VRIFVNTFTGTTITLDLDANDTIKDVKQWIHDFEGVPSSKQCLRQNGTPLEDDRSLAYYDIGSANQFVAAPDLSVCGGSARRASGVTLDLELQLNTLTLRAGGVGPSMDVIPEGRTEIMSFTFGDEKLSAQRAYQTQAQVIIGSTYGVHSANASTESMMHVGVLLGAADGKPLFNVAGRTFQYALMHRYCSKFILTCTNTEAEAKQSLNFGACVDVLGAAHKSSVTMLQVVKAINERNGQACRIDKTAAKQMIYSGQFEQRSSSTNCLDTALALFQATGGDTGSVVGQMKEALFGSAKAQLHAVHGRQTEVTIEADRDAEAVEAALQSFIDVHEGQGSLGGRFLREAAQCTEVAQCMRDGVGISALGIDALLCTIRRAEAELDAAWGGIGPQLDLCSHGPE